MKVKLTALVLDFEVYPRGSVDSVHVRDFCEALISGADLPPIVACKKTKRVVDGFHRIAAHKRVFGDDAEIDVVFKTYKNDAAFFLDVAKFNGAHGLPLDRADQIRCCHIAERLGLSDEDLAAALHMPVEKLAALKVDRTAYDRASKLSVSLKNPLRHLRGRKLSKEQVRGNEKLSGTNTLLKVRELIIILETQDFLDETNENVFKALEKLGALITERLAVAK